MSVDRQVDVIVYDGSASAEAARNLEQLLECDDAILGRVIAIAGRKHDPDETDDLEQLTPRDRRLTLVRTNGELGRVAACAHAMAERQGDVVLLSAGTQVTAGWLSELSSVAHAEERTAGVSPLSNADGFCAVPRLGRATPAEMVCETTVKAACAGLPRWTTVPALDGNVAYLRGDVIEAVGPLDPTCTTVAGALDDLLRRALEFGFHAKRANHAFVLKRDGRRALREGNGREYGDPRGPDRRPLDFSRQVKAFGSTLDAPLAAHAVALHVSGKLAVALDLRHLPVERVGTRIHGVSLANALADRPDIELTLLVHHVSQADGLRGRVVTERDWRDDVAVIHKPGQVLDERDLELLFGSSAHVVITYQDMIAYRCPLAFNAEAHSDRYRVTSSLSLLAAQRIVVFSTSTAGEVRSEFGVSGDDVIIVPLGVDADSFSRRDPFDEEVLSALELPPHYFLSLNTDLPHKNLSSLLDAYTLLRSRWRRGEPPALVFAGYALGTRSRLYSRLQSEPVPDGVVVLGPVADGAVRLLYQHALALVYPSLYEGFGLPPLEAMAAGTPVVALPISSVPEVGGDSVLYPKGLSAGHLAEAMEEIATDGSLRSTLRERGRRRVEHFRWERTARAIVDVYRAAVLRPSAASLQRRRNLHGAIVHWSRSPAPPAPVLESLPLTESEPLGIKNALTALNGAVYRRLHREFRRLRPVVGAGSD